ncbi:MAG TPA: HepT-like ribonuclease domain-containing protein [Stellaceae bacterium]|nr:HepT-like ribonuclease domain-containing protein [Stellaceae bacterium]
MIGMRNRLVHAYFDVDIDTLWDTVTNAAPPLARRVAEILAG